MKFNKEDCTFEEEWQCPCGRTVRIVAYATQDLLDGNSATLRDYLKDVIDTEKAIHLAEEQDR